MSQQRPKTIREMQAEKTKEIKVGQVTIMNISNQLIKIHLKAPKGVDFFVGAQDINLGPGQTHSFKKNRLWLPQVERLQKQQKIQVISDSEQQN